MAVQPQWPADEQVHGLRWLVRPRLTSVLDAADAQAVVLCAPAGYGKTVLARQWLEGRPVAWCTPAGGAEALARVDGASEGWLAIEDYHLLADSVDADVERLLALTQVRLLVTTRRRPGWATARRVLYGEVVELGREELALTPAETSAIVGDCAPGLRELVDGAEGWPAVVALAARASAQRVPPDRLADTLSRYIADEVLRPEPPELQSLMLEAAVPERVAAHDQIAALEESGLLVPAGDGFLRFHPLVRRFLLRTLESRDPARWSALHDEAIADARAGGRVADSIELALAARRLELAAELLAESATDLIAAGQLETVERWLVALGDAAEENPRIRLARAEVLLRRGEPFAAAELAEEVAAALPAGDPNAANAWRLAGAAHHVLSDPERALYCYQRAADVATATADRVTALRNVISLAAEVDEGSLEERVEQLAAVAGDDLDARLQLLPARVFLASRRDSLAPLWSLAEPLLTRVDEAVSPTTRTTFLRAAAYLAVARADYGRGHQLAERALLTCEEFQLGQSKRALCLCSRAAADIGRRQLGRAEAALEELPSLAIEHTEVLIGERRNLQTKLLLARGDLERALAVVAHSAEGPVAEQRGLLAVAAAAAGDLVRARAEVEAASSGLSLIEARSYARFAHVIIRLVEEGPTPAVRAAASELVAYADAAEILDAFVIAYRAYPPLVELVAGDPAVAPVVSAVLLQANDHALARRARIRLADVPVTDSLVEALTPRENEVLRLMAEGLGNREIARRLFISEKTTKVHVGHIFDKLGVESRVQAVLAAQRLGGAL
jgi:LuxR family transcriptional regulator, maltose regulon positive regulatory protein